jgi:antitoxin ParD1/3/4
MKRPRKEFNLEVTLSPTLQQFVEQKVRTGSFSSATDVVAGALKLLKLEDEISGLDPEQLRVQIEEGMDESRRGLSTPLDMEEIKRQVHERASSLRR